MKWRTGVYAEARVAVWYTDSQLYGFAVRIIFQNQFLLFATADGNTGPVEG